MLRRGADARRGRRQEAGLVLGDEVGKGFTKPGEENQKHRAQFRQEGGLQHLLAGGRAHFAGKRRELLGQGMLLGHTQLLTNFAPEGKGI